MLMLAVPLRAADLELGIRHLSTWPRGEKGFDGGDLEVVSSRGFGATAELFWTPRVSTQLAATFINPAAIVFPTNPPPNDLDLGTFGMDTYSVTARYHVAPDARFSPFVGAGGAMVIFGDLEDRFGDDIEMTFEHQIAPVVEGGVRCRLFERVRLEVSASYMPLEATPNHLRNDTTVPLPSSVSVDPLTVSFGAAWRF